MELRLTNSTQTSDSLWQNVLDRSAAGLVVYEADSNGDSAVNALTIRLANRRAEEIMGIQRSRSADRNATGSFVQELPETHWTTIQDVLTSGRARQQEVRFAGRQTREARWFNADIQPLGDGHSVVVSYIDITDLKTVTDSLIGESILFKTLSSTVPGLCVVVVDTLQTIRLANGVLPGLFVSTGADAVLGKPILETIMPEYQDDWFRYIQSALQGEQHNFSDHWGGWRCECYVGPVASQQSEIAMVLCVFRDVTEQYHQQQALRRLNNDLQRSNESLEQFAYMASHDLQEPLRKIKSFGDILNERYTDSLGEAGTGMILRMQSAADRMNALIKSLLSYARLTGQTQQHRNLVSFEALITDIVTDLEVMINERSAIVTAGPDLPSVPGDATQLRQLFQNLIANAIKFTRPDQHPEVSIKGRLIPGEAVPDFPDLDPTEEYALINVQDNGIGIAPENFDKIFGLFSRLHARHEFVGSGIGLATCRRIAENHGGTITLESQVDKGTTFHVYLPMHVAKVALAK